MVIMCRSRKRKFQSSRIDRSTVPINLFSLKGEPFYKLVEEITSEDIKNLLEIQKISTARCFLNTNSLDFLNVHSDDPLILQLQSRLSYKVANDENLVFAGINEDVRHLTELFKVYLMEEKNQQISETESDVSLHTTRQSPSIDMTSSSIPPRSSDMPNLSLEEHRDYLIQQITCWWEKHRHQYHLENHQFVEPRDYELKIGTNSASIMCSCGKKIDLPLPKGRHYYQLSNFYKHLTKNSKCTTIKRKRTSSENEEERDDDDDEELFSSPPSTSISSTPLRQSCAIMKANYHRHTTLSINRSSSESKRKRTRR